MIYIRSDMNDIIATGHVMRCLSIADAAKEMGEEVTFILADNQAEDYIISRGYQVIVLASRWDAMEMELSVLLELIKEKNIESILIDSYQVTEKYLAELTKVTRTIYLDDLNAFHYPVDSIICYANYYKKFAYEENYPADKLYLGLNYVPLRKEFQDCCPKVINEQVKNLLLLSGGTDNYHILRRLLERIDLVEYQQVHVICGKYNADYEDLKLKNKDCTNVYIHKAVTDMKRYMEEADLVISAGGSTLYELCAVGTPAISYSFADNQLDNVRKFQEDGMIDYAGDIRCDNVMDNVVRLLERYANNKALRQERSIKIQKIVDGYGARRIAEVI